MLHNILSDIKEVSRGSDKRVGGHRRKESFLHSHKVSAGRFRSSRKAEKIQASEVTRWRKLDLIRGSQSKILIVDSRVSEDSAFWAGLFPAENFRLLAAKNVQEAFAIFGVDHPDLIVIRTRVDGDLGRDLCRKVRIQEGQRHTGIVFLDDHSEARDSVIVDCLESGADEFINGKSSSAEVLARIRAVLRLKCMTDDLRSANHRLQLLSFTDELTGLANMRCFSQKYMSALKICRAGHTGLGIMMIDLDHFKKVNDSSNHLVGSYVIGEVGRLIKSSGLLATSDIAARYGGDEYILCCSAHDLTQIVAKAEALRVRIFGSHFDRDGVTIRLTASIGCAFIEPGYNGKAEAPIKAADLMLYRSKSLGRDRVSGLLLHSDTDLANLSRFIESKDNLKKAPAVSPGRKGISLGKIAR